MNTFRLTIASPDGNMFDADAVNLSLRGVEGDLAIMANHVPFVTSVKEGVCTVTLEDGKVLHARTSGGLLTVGNNKATLLSSGFVFEKDE